MKKVSLFLGALGGGLAGYLFSNRRLRDELANAKDPKGAAKILGQHLSKDGEKLAKDMKDFLESEQMQRNIDAAKKYAHSQYKRAKVEIERMAGVGAAKAPAAVRKAKRKITQKVRTLKKG